MATFPRGEVTDKVKMELTVSGSGLDWVITQPAFLTRKPATGDVRIFSGSRDHPHVITRSDLAAFMVAQLTTDDYLGEPSASRTGDRGFTARQHHHSERPCGRARPMRAPLA